MKRRIVIVGAGGHGRVVADALLRQGTFEIAGFADDLTAKGTDVIDGIAVVASTSEEQLIRSLADGFVIAVGNNEHRARLFEKFSLLLEPFTVIHPAASVSPFATIGKGGMVMAGAVVGAGAVIGDNCIINVQSLVDHDCAIGANSHIAQGALVGSGCKTPPFYTLALGDRLPSYSVVS